MSTLASSGMEGNAALTAGVRQHHCRQCAWYRPCWYKKQFVGFTWKMAPPEIQQIFKIINELKWLAIMVSLSKMFLQPQAWGPWAFQVLQAARSDTWQCMNPESSMCIYMLFSYVEEQEQFYFINVFQRNINSSFLMLNSGKPWAWGLLGREPLGGFEVLKNFEVFQSICSRRKLFFGLAFKV